MTEACCHCLHCRPLTYFGRIVGQMCDHDESEYGGIEVEAWSVCELYEPYREPMKERKLVREDL